LPAIDLIGDGREDKAVGYDGLSFFERGCNEFCYHLCACREEQKQLRRRIDAACVLTEYEIAYLFAERSAAGVASEDRTLRQDTFQFIHHHGFPGAFAALEHNEFAPRHMHVLYSEK